MTERSRLWDGTTTGDASEAPYDFGTELSQVLSALGGADPVTTYRGGVFRDVLNKYAGTPGTDTITIDTGRGLVYGSWHEADAAVAVAVTRPAASDRYDYITLRKSWSAQTVRITRVAGVEGGGAGSPTLVNTAGTTWDVPLYLIKITAAGAVSIITDMRTFIPWHGNQGAESGTKHAYSQISGTPSIAGTVTSVVPGAAGTAGASGALSDGAHQHPLAAALLVVKTASEGYASAVMHSDAQLTVALEASSKYWFQATILLSSSFALTNIGVGLILPAGATLAYGALGPQVADPTLLQDLHVNVADAGTQFGVDSSAARVIRISGSIITAGNAGNATFRWNTTGTTVNVLVGSTLYAVKQ